MKTIASIVVVSIGLFMLQSCASDHCKQTITYTKATAQYGNLDDYRIVDIVESPRAEIESPGKVYLNDNILLIGERGEGIHVYDNSDPSNPTPMTFLNIPGSYEFFVHEGKVFSNSYYDLVQIDISDPTNIQLTDREEMGLSPRFLSSNVDQHIIGFDYEEVTEEVGCDHNFQSGETYFFNQDNILLDRSAIPSSFVANGNTIGTANRMGVTNDNRLIVINNRESFVFSIANNEVNAEQHTGLHRSWGNLETIYILDDLVFIGSTSSMDLYNIEGNRFNQLGHFAHATACDPVLPLESGIAYVTLRSGDECPGDENTLNVVDFRPATNGQIFIPAIQSINMSHPFGMAIINDQLYVGEGEYGMKIFEIEESGILSLRETVSDFPVYDVIAHPTNAEIILVSNSNGIRQIQLSDEGYQDVSAINF